MTHNELMPMKRCTEFQHVEEEWAFNDLLEAERRYAKDSPEIEAAKREYDMLRQRNARLCRRHGLKNPQWTAAAWLLERKYPYEYAQTTRKNEDACGNGADPSRRDDFCRRGWRGALLSR